MKNKWTTSICVKTIIPGMLLLALLFIFFPVSALLAANPIELRFTTTVTSIHPNFRAIEQYAAEVGSRTNGRVKITVYPGGTLNPPLETYNAVKTGIAQMGSAPVGYSGRVMPLNKLFGDALRGVETATEVAKMYAIALKDVPELMDEYEGVHLLWVTSTLPLSVGTVSRPIHKMEDFEGLVMRFPPGLEPLAKAWGASPISVSVADIYTSLQKNTINGFIGGSEMLKAMRLAEHIKYVTNLSMIYGISYSAMNKRTWDSLPPDIQQVFNDLNERGQSLILTTLDESEKSTEEFARSQGCQFYQIDKAQIKKIQSVSKKVFQEMAQKLEDRGKPANKVLAEIDKLAPPQ